MCSIENFLEHFEKKIDLKKEGFIKNFQLNFCFIFEIIVNLHFSFNLIRLVYRMVPIFLLAQRASSVAFKYLERSRKVNKKFSEAFKQRLYLYKNYHRRNFDTN